ncbi:MAG: HD-GYP domain-containing protein [Spirochaetota bacterium]
MLERCELEQLKAGMIIGAAVSSERNNATLIEADTVLSEKMIDTLKKHEVSYVFVKIIKEPAPAAEEPRAAPVVAAASSAPERPRPAVVITDLVTNAKQEIIDRNFTEEAGKTILRIDSAQAIELKGKTVEKTMQIFQKVRGDGKLDFKSMKDEINALIAEIYKNQQAFLNLSVIKNASHYTYQHSVDVSSLAVLVGKSMNLHYTEVALLGFGGLMHDIGLSTIPAEILEKKGKLTESEREKVKQHPLDGYNRIVKQDVDPKVSQVVLQHHEWINGNGYPSKAAGASIMTVSKVIAICDVYSALVTNDRYRPPFPPYKAVQMIMGEAGSHFDMNIAKAFQQVMGLYPNGSMVRLADGTTARVIDQNPGALLYPIVQVVKDKDGKTANGVEIIDIKEKRDKFVKEVLSGIE